MSGFQKIVNRLAVYRTLFAPIETKLENHIAWIQVTKLGQYNPKTPKYVINVIELTMQKYEAWQHGSDIDCVTDATSHKRLFAKDDEELGVQLAAYLDKLSILKNSKAAHKMGYKFMFVLR